MEVMEEDTPRSPEIHSLWPVTEDLLDDFDPFETDIPGDTIRQKLRYLFVRGLIRKNEELWWAPNENLMIKTVKALYVAMVGFKKENLHLLYPSGTMGHTLEDLWLTKVQKVTDGPSVRDRCCGHVFEKGETYYRCKYLCSVSFLLTQTMLC